MNKELRKNGYSQWIISLPLCYLASREIVSCVNLWEGMVPFAWGFLHQVPKSPGLSLLLPLSYKEDPCFQLGQLTVVLAA